MMLGYIGAVAVLLLVMGGAAYVASHSTGEEQIIAEEVEEGAKELLAKELAKKL